MEVKLDAVLIGRILAGVIIVLAVISAIMGAVSTRTGSFDLFLWRLTTPLGIGFLIILAVELLRAIESVPDEADEETGTGEDAPVDEE